MSMRIMEDILLFCFSFTYQSTSYTDKRITDSDVTKKDPLSISNGTLAKTYKTNVKDTAIVEDAY